MNAPKQNRAGEAFPYADLNDPALVDSLMPHLATPLKGLSLTIEELVVERTEKLDPLIFPGRSVVGPLPTDELFWLVAAVIRCRSARKQLPWLALQLLQNKPDNVLLLQQPKQKT